MTVLSWRVALRLAMPGAVVTWLVAGFPDLSSGKERSAWQAVSTVTSYPWRSLAASRSRGSADTRRHTVTAYGSSHVCPPPLRHGPLVDLRYSSPGLRGAGMDLADRSLWCRRPSCLPGRCRSHRHPRSAVASPCQGRAATISRYSSLVKARRVSVVTLPGLEGPRAGKVRAARRVGRVRCGWQDSLTGYDKAGRRRRSLLSPPGPKS
jgi:hypothetical protein